MVDGHPNVPHAVPVVVLLEAVLARALVAPVALPGGAPRVIVAGVALFCNIWSSSKRDGVGCAGSVPGGGRSMARAQPWDCFKLLRNPTPDHVQSQNKNIFSTARARRSLSGYKTTHISTQRETRIRNEANCCGQAKRLGRGENNKSDEAYAFQSTLGPYIHERRVRVGRGLKPGWVRSVRSRHRVSGWMPRETSRRDSGTRNKTAIAPTLTLSNT